MPTTLELVGMSRHMIRVGAALGLCATSVCVSYAQPAAKARPAPSVAASAQQPGVRLTPIRTIGTLDGPPEYAFGQLGEIAADRRGRMYTYDQKDHQLRAYDAAGKFVALHCLHPRASFIGPSANLVRHLGVGHRSSPTTPAECSYEFPCANPALVRDPKGPTQLPAPDFSGSIPTAAWLTQSPWCFPNSPSHNREAFI